MNALLLSLTLAAIPNAHRYTLTDGHSPRRVHVFVDAETRDVELVRVNAVRAGYYRGYAAVAVDADRLCRGSCDLDVDVDPRLDYVLRVGDEEPRTVDLTSHGDSVIVKVTPPSTGLRGGGTAMLVGGIVTTAVGGVTTLSSLMSFYLHALSGTSYGNANILGVDSTFLIAAGLGAVAVGVANIIVGAILKRHAAMEIDTMPGDLQPSGDPQPPPPPPPPSGTAVM